MAPGGGGCSRGLYASVAFLLTREVRTTKGSAAGTICTCCTPCCLLTAAHLPPASLPLTHNASTDLLVFFPPPVFYLRSTGQERPRSPCDAQRLHCFCCFCDSLPPVLHCVRQGKNGIPLLSKRRPRDVELMMNDDTWLK